MTKPNTPHQQRVAKALHHTVERGCQEALRRVREAAAAGLLPARPRTGTDVYRSEYPLAQ